MSWPRAKCPPPPSQMPQREYSPQSVGTTTVAGEGWSESCRLFVCFASLPFLLLLHILLCSFSPQLFSSGSLVCDLFVLLLPVNPPRPPFLLFPTAVSGSRMKNPTEFGQAGQSDACLFLWERPDSVFFPGERFQTPLQ